MLHRMLRAMARPDHTVEISWEDGSTSILSFAGLESCDGVCTPMRDPAFFVEKMSLADEGFALAWPDEVEVSADGLWYETIPRMRDGTRLPQRRAAPPSSTIASTGAAGCEQIFAGNA
jgi:Protein of unknown function (DUF2442)